MSYEEFNLYFNAVMHMSFLRFTYWLALIILLPLAFWMLYLAVADISTPFGSEGNKGRIAKDITFCLLAFGIFSGLSWLNGAAG